MRTGYVLLHHERAGADHVLPGELVRLTGRVALRSVELAAAALQGAVPVAVVVVGLEHHGVLVQGVDGFRFRFLDPVEAADVAAAAGRFVEPAAVGEGDVLGGNLARLHHVVDGLAGPHDAVANLQDQLVGGHFPALGHAAHLVGQGQAGIVGKGERAVAADAELVYVADLDPLADHVLDRGRAGTVVRIGHAEGVGQEVEHRDRAAVLRLGRPCRRRRRGFLLTAGEQRQRHDQQGGRQNVWNLLSHDSPRYRDAPLHPVILSSQSRSLSRTRYRFVLLEVPRAPPHTSLFAAMLALSAVPLPASLARTDLVNALPIPITP